MEFKLLHFLAFLYVAIIASDATLPSEEYWNSALPNTPLPKAVKDLLQPDTGVEVGHGGVRVNVGGHGHNVNVDPFFYNYAATETQLHDNPNVALFFLERDLHAGKKMTLQFSTATNKTAFFLPRQVADSIPFSSDKLPEILNMLSVQPGSDEAEVIKKAIKECEETAIKGEEKCCATSLESMVDFTTSKLGKDVRVISTEANDGERKVYRFVGVDRAPSEKSGVVCHSLEYAYAVFYCHKVYSTVAYEVALQGAGGSKAKAVAVCHKDTASWNPKHLAFQVLNVKPGTVPICHFLPEDHIVWVPNS